MNVASKQQTGRPPYGIIAILLAGAFVSILSSTLLNIALPTISKDLGVAIATVQWLATGYMLVNGVLIPTTAFLIQKFSVRHLFIAAILLFTIGTISAGLSTSFEVLLISRMIQAAGSAVMMPLLMNVLLTSFPIEKRGGAMGILGLVMIFAPAIGPTLSGWIVEHYDWRMLFHVITPFGVLVTLFAFFLLKDKKGKVNIKLDVLSVILSSIGFGGLLYGLSSAASKGWSSPEVYGTLIAGALGLICLVLRQFQTDTPMLDFRVYKYPMFTLSSMISVIINMALFSGMILMPLYLQNLRGITPMHSGMLMLPGAILMGIMSPITGKLFDKYGARILSGLGILITGVTTYYFSQLTLTTSYTSLIVIYSVRMFGMSMVMMPIMTNGLNQLPRRLNPHGTAINSTLSQVSGAIGSAVLVTVMSRRAVTHGEELMRTAISKLTDTPTADVLEQLKFQIMPEATLEGINDAFLVSVGLMGLAFILALFIKRSRPAE